MKRAVRFASENINAELCDVRMERTGVVHFMQNYNNVSVTENGATGYRTTKNPLLDLNFMVSSLRNRNEEFIVNAFVKAYYADWKYAVKWLFFLRDVWEGLGERRSFRICLKYLAISKPQVALAVMKLIPEYGRFDDLLAYIDTPLCKDVCAFLGEQLAKDVEALECGKPVSLLAKWLPSNNTSSKEARRYAAIIANEIGMSPRQYRKTLARLRTASNVVEVQISAKDWADVDYEKVPAKANLKYDAAFYRHDAGRRTEYIKQAFLGEANVNAKGLMPYEIVHKFMRQSMRPVLHDNILAELMWQKMLADGFNNEWGLDDCIVVADGSGSMYTNVSGSTSIRAIEVCNALAIYFAEQLKGVFHNKAITFSGRPEFIDLAPGKNLKEKLEIMLAHNEVANTNIEAVFDMLLAMAVSNQVPKEELPKQVLIISDMEFDSATAPDYWSYSRKENTSWRKFDETLFETISRKFDEAGYTMPRLIFWNVCGRTDTIPMVEGDNGICLLSGFSQNAAKIAANREIRDPYERLIKVLDGERYKKVEDALAAVV